ncbi:hypothetical protein V6O07_12790 [Arthrospira platensis SPKY2]
MFVLVFGLTPAASAQETDGELAEGAAAAIGEAGDRRFRDTAGYPFGAPASTVRAMQHLATAMQLRAYCADPNVPDAFVRLQLQRFSEMTGREESCRSLLDY